MALSKEIDVGIGINAKYWRIENIGITVGKTSVTACANMYGYITKTAAQTGSKSVGERMQYPFDDGADFLVNDPIAVAYQKIKVLEEWEGSADV